MSFAPRKDSDDASLPGSSWPAQLLVTASLLWTVGALAAPVLAASKHTVAAAAARMLYSPVCHQEISRSFSLFGYPLSVCHRCAAVYAAFSLGTLALGITSRGRLRGMPLNALGAALLPLICDIGLDLLGVLSNTPITRVVTGAIAGGGLALFVFPAAREIGRERLAPRGESHPTARTCIHERHHCSPGAE